MGGNSTKKIAFNYFGGKFSWLDELYYHFPRNFTHLVDVFAGSMVVAINYNGKVIKTANEINGDVTNFFRVLRDHEDELIKMLELTPCSLEEYNRCWTQSKNDLENARRFYVRVRQSFFGLGMQRENKGWHMAKSHVNCQGGETVSRWNNGILKLPEVAQTIRTNFQITNFDFRECINKTDFEGAFFYVDPPYDHCTRASSNDYKFEITDQDRVDLSEILHKIKGKAMISGYPGGITEDLYKDWTMIKFPIKRNNIRSSLRKKDDQIQSQECIWMNYDPFVEKGQLKLL